MSDTTELQARRLEQMKEGDKTFEVNEKVLVVGAKLCIEGVVKALGCRDATNPNRYKAVELRVVKEEIEDGNGPVVGGLVKTIISENGKIVRVDFDYVPNVPNDWKKEDFCINASAYHVSHCVKASIVQRMMCICGLPMESLCI